MKFYWIIRYLSVKFLIAMWYLIIQMYWAIFNHPTVVG